MKTINIQHLISRAEDDEGLLYPFTFDPSDEEYESGEPDEAYDYDGHRLRLRKRIENEGLERLRSREVVEYLLYHTIARQDVNPAAFMILERFGTIHNFLNSSREDLEQLNLWEGAADFLHELFSRMQHMDPQDESMAQRMNNFLEAMRHVKWMKQAYTGECCAAACTDICGNMVYHTRLGSGRRWAENPASGALLESIVSSNARGVVIMLFTDKKHLQFTDYERRYAPQFLHILKSMNCALLDIICANNHGAISIRRTNILDGAPVAPQLKMVCEEYQASIDSYFANKVHSLSGGKHAGTESF